jgi:hypothetical protein
MTVTHEQGQDRGQEREPGGELRWNLFARELEDVLAERGLRLGHLDDRKNALREPLVHREKVRRLQLSLRTPKTFTTLNTEDLARVIAGFDLSEPEQVRIRAALLATAVEALLMDRIAPKDAYRAAEQLLPILRQALREPARAGDLGKIRGGGGSGMGDEYAEFDSQFAKALDALDRATLALQLSDLNPGEPTQLPNQEKVAQARQALDGFQTAMRLLERADASTRGQEAWQLWHDEATRGRKLAVQALAHFGIQPGEQSDESPA